MPSEKPNGSLKEKVLGVLILLFVLFLAASFAYFLLLPRPSASGSAKVFFFKNGELAGVVRKFSGEQSFEKAAVDELLMGPTAKEKAEGYFSEIPPGTKMNRVNVEGDVAFVDFNRKVGEYGGGTSSIQGIVAQVVYTLTEIKGIRKVGILIDGKSEVALGAEGYVIEKLLSRSDISF